MRIQLYLTPPSLPPTTAPADLSSTQQIPGPLTALTPSGELILIELQGSLEMDSAAAGSSSSSSAAASSGQVVGELMWGDGKEDKPTLLLSHHKLEGKLVNLTKPLAVLKKCKRSSQLEEADLVENEDEDEDEDEGDETIRPRDDSNDLGDDDDEANTHRQPQSHGLPPSSPPNSQDIHLEMRALADSSSDDDEDEDGAGILQASPSLQRGKKRSPSRKQHTPTKSRRTRTNNTTTHSPPFPSSSPGPPPPMRGSAIDFSSPPPDGETTKDTRQRRTQVSYDVICIIRKKVLFSKRPEPVVHRA